MAIVISLFLLLVFGAIEFAIVMSHANRFTEAVRAGARFAIVHNPVHDIPADADPGTRIGEGVNCLAIDLCEELIETMEKIAPGPAFSKRPGLMIEVVYQVPEQEIGIGSPYVATVSIKHAKHKLIVPEILGLDAELSLPTFTSTRTTESLETLNGPE